MGGMLQHVFNGDQQACGTPGTQEKACPAQIPDNMKCQLLGWLCELQNFAMQVHLRMLQGTIMLQEHNCFLLAQTVHHVSHYLFP
jgi:hypothetical protein